MACIEEILLRLTHKAAIKILRLVIDSVWELDDVFIFFASFVAPLFLSLVHRCYVCVLLYDYLLRKGLLLLKENQGEVLYLDSA